MCSCFIHHVFTQMVLQNILATLGGGVGGVEGVGEWGLNPVTCPTAQVRMNLQHAQYITLYVCKIPLAAGLPSPHTPPDCFYSGPTKPDRRSLHR